MTSQPSGLVPFLETLCTSLEELLAPIFTFNVENGKLQILANGQRLDTWDFGLVYDNRPFDLLTQRDVTIHFFTEVPSLIIEANTLYGIPAVDEAIWQMRRSGPNMVLEPEQARPYLDMADGRRWLRPIAFVPTS